jgi:uncharacterized protein YndB with AHSA1/START domain
MTSRILVATRVRATPERAFQAFTGEIGAWWRPNGLFQFSGGGPGAVALEEGLEGRFTETMADGSIFEIGRISIWDPPHLLAFSWRQASFSPQQSTEVHVHFEPAGDDTRITVEHFGWDSVPQEHVARHHFPDAVFLQRHAEWWQTLLGSLKQQVAATLT